MINNFFNCSNLIEVFNEKVLLLLTNHGENTLLIMRNMN